LAIKTILADTVQFG